MVKLILVFNGGFARYRRFGVFGLHGHFDPIAIVFLVFGGDLPPHFQVF
jgi:hypothetical protein